MRWIKRIIFVLVIGYIVLFIFSKIPSVFHKGILIEIGVLAGLVVIFLALEKLKVLVNRWEEKLKAAKEGKVKIKMRRRIRGRLGIG